MNEYRLCYLHIRRIFCSTNDLEISKSIPYGSKILVTNFQNCVVCSEGTIKPITVYQGIYKTGNLTFDLSNRDVLIDTRRIHLTSLEFKLLMFLAKNVNKAISRDDILLAVWGDVYSGDENLLRAQIYNLRRKIEVNPTHPTLILNIVGVGYKFVSVDPLTKI